jgi:hypothetical protein
VPANEDDWRASLLSQLTLKFEADRILARQIQNQAGRLVGTGKSQEF